MDDLEREQKRDMWRASAKCCKPSACNEHDWMPISYVVTKEAKHVSVVMCKKCFHHLNISDVYANRETD